MGLLLGLACLAGAALLLAVLVTFVVAAGPLAWLLLVLLSLGAGRRLWRWLDTPDAPAPVPTGELTCD